MRRRTLSTGLRIEEDHRSEDGDEVQREVEHVADDSLRAELLERAFGKLAKLADGVGGAGFDLTSLSDNGGHVSGEKGAIEGVEQGVIDEECLGEDIDDGGGLGKGQEYGGEGGERTVEEGEDRGLWQIGENEHEAYHANRESESRHQLRKERLPESLVR